MVPRAQSATLDGASPVSDRSAARRLIESAFPLKEASIDSVHEKNVRHGHISTLHVWPARRPLAASRAVLLATLLDDPGGDGRKDLLRRIAGNVVKKESERGEKEETIGGVLHWGRESSPDLTRLRDEIREAFGGRAPRVLDPFAGGGAIPLEAMRLGCEVTASDLNPVAWFILRCTLHYPRLMARQTRPLPDFALRDRVFRGSVPQGAGGKKKERPAIPPCASRARRRIGRTANLLRRRSAGTKCGLSLAPPRLGAASARRCAPGACLVLPDLCGVRAAQTQGPSRQVRVAAEAVQAARTETSATG